MENKRLSVKVINSILENENINTYQFALKIGIKPQPIYDILDGKIQRITPNFAEKIIKAFPKYSKDWLLTGKGEMLKSESNPQPKQTEMDFNRVLDIMEKQAKAFENLSNNDKSKIELEKLKEEQRAELEKLKETQKSEAEKLRVELEKLKEQMRHEEEKMKHEEAKANNDNIKELIKLLKEKNSPLAESEKKMETILSGTSSIKTPHETST